MTTRAIPDTRKEGKVKVIDLNSWASTKKNKVELKPDKKIEKEQCPRK